MKDYFGTKKSRWAPMVGFAFAFIYIVTILATAVAITPPVPGERHHWRHR